MSKGISEIATAALYVGVSIGAISTALTVGLPAIENMQDASAIRSAQDFMQRFDAAVDQVVAEGRGSTREISFSIDRGRLFYSNESNALVYELETDAGVISPQSSREVGNVILSSNADTTVTNVTDSSDLDGYTGPDCILMENEHIQACIKRVGGPNNQQSINTSDLLTHYEFKDSSRELDGNLSVKIDDDFESSWGQGYTTTNRYGEFIGTGRVVAHVESDRFTYDVVFQLPTGSDFIKVDVQNVR